VGNEGAVQWAVGELDDADVRSGLLLVGWALVAEHVAAMDGRCAGCQVRGNTVLAPCGTARFWRGVVETHGVIDWDMWFPPAAVCGSCVGRGWKFVVSRAGGLWADSLSGLVLRSCVDCAGEGVVRHG
jgi:hypothetical protein